MAKLAFSRGKITLMVCGIMCVSSICLAIPRFGCVVAVSTTIFAATRMSLWLAWCLFLSCFDACAEPSSVPPRPRPRPQPQPQRKPRREEHRAPSSPSREAQRRHPDPHDHDGRRDHAIDHISRLWSLWIQQRKHKSCRGRKIRRWRSS